MKAVPPVKHKCLGCGNEKWIKQYDLDWDEYSVPKPIKCEKCGYITVPKKRWTIEMIDEIQFNLAQVYKWEVANGEFKKIECATNTWLDKVFNKLDLLKQQERRG